MREVDGRSASQWAWFQDYIIIIIIYGLLIYDNKALCNYCTHPMPADATNCLLILLPSAPLFQRTVFAVDSFFFSAPIFPLSDPLFQKPFVFHGIPSVGLT